MEPESAGRLVPRIAGTPFALVESARSTRSSLQLLPFAHLQLPVHMSLRCLKRPSPENGLSDTFLGLAFKSLPGPCSSPLSYYLLAFLRRSQQGSNAIHI